MTESFVVPVAPVGKGRPRFSSTGHAYTPAKTRDYESMIAYHARRAAIHLHEGPIMVTLEFMMPIPCSWSKAKQKQAMDGLMYPTVKPDIDNLTKAVLDALNGIAYQDDKSIVHMVVKKVYAEATRTKITITDL